MSKADEVDVKPGKHFDLECLAKWSRESRARVLKLTSNSKTSHVASSLSCIDLLVTIYAFKRRVLINQDSLQDIDILIFSKGHAAAAYYSVARVFSEITEEDWSSYCKSGSNFLGHVSHDGKSCVALATGSLGHGLPFGIGLAIAKKTKGEPGVIFVIISDGECDEGTTWESALIASHHRLGNLCVLIDRNRLQSITSTEDTLALEPLTEKWSSFGWNVIEVDGHDHESILNAIQFSIKDQSPTCIIANTVKGKGVSFMENDNLWHYRFPDAQTLDAALKELDIQ